MRQFNTIGLVGKYMDAAALAEMQLDLADLATYLRDKGVQVLVEKNTAKHAAITGFKNVPLADFAKVDLAIVMGGDGTMLSVARTLLDAQIPIVGVNRGRFGFLTDLRTEGMLQAMDELLSGRYRAASRMLLSGQIMRDGKIIQQSVAMNDVVVKSALRLIEFDVKIDGKFVHKQRADGLIVATPTGTTAYALSSGGPILHPNLEAIALVPISPHTLSNRPIAVSSASHIEVTVIQADDAHASFDGQVRVELQVGDCVRIERADKMMTLIHPQNYDYFEMLRNKLNWS